MRAPASLVLWIVVCVLGSSSCASVASAREADLEGPTPCGLGTTCEPGAGGSGSIALPVLFAVALLGAPIIVAQIRSVIGRAASSTRTGAR